MPTEPPNANPIASAPICVAQLATEMRGPRQRAKIDKDSAFDEWVFRGADVKADGFAGVLDHIRRAAAGEWVMSGTFLGESFGVLPTGKAFRVQGCCFMRILDGRIVEHRDYWNPATFGRQVRI